MRVATAIRDRLTEALAPTWPEITNDSARHAGARPEGETHVRVGVASAAFEGVGRIERQRRVYAALAAETATDILAFALTTRTPVEDAG